jgi:hypothetical protein
MMMVLRMRLGLLRKLISEEVERNMRWSAGMFSGGLSGKGSGAVVAPPPGLGDDEKEEVDGEEEP